MTNRSALLPPAVIEIATGFALATTSPDCHVAPMRSEPLAITGERVLAVTKRWDLTTLTIGVSCILIVSV